MQTPKSVRISISKNTLYTRLVGAHYSPHRKASMAAHQAPFMSTMCLSLPGLAAVSSCLDANMRDTPSVAWRFYVDWRILIASPYVKAEIR